MQNIHENSVDRIAGAIRNDLVPEEILHGFSALTKTEKTSLITALRDIKTESAGVFLNGVLKYEDDKEIKKQIKKLLFRLKSMGIQVADPEVTGEPVLHSVKEERTHYGYLSNYDEEGVRLVIASFEIKRHLYAFFHGTVHYREGLQNLMTTVVKKTDLNRVTRDFQNSSRPPFVVSEISAGYSGFLLQEGSAISGRYADEALRLREFIAGLRAEVKRPEDIYTLPVDETISSPPFEEIVKHAYFKPFHLSWSTLEEDRASYQAIGEGTIVLPPHITQERKKEFIATLLERDEFRRLKTTMKRLLEDFAYLFYCLGEKDIYRGLIDALLMPETPGDVLADTVRGIMGKQPQETHAAPGLIVNPYEQIRR